jgi:nucleotide-binding universal stress UspA family protein
MYLETLVASLHRGPLAALKLTITWSTVVNTDVAGTIITQTEQQGYGDLIAMATHGRRGLTHFMMGSVTERVLDHTRLPLLVLRPQAAYEVTTHSARNAHSSQ